MTAVYTLLVILFVLLLVHRITSTTLELTGLSRDSARLQALSALTGVGFTTRESEMIVDHPVRRRVVMVLMLLGNTGIVTVIGSVVVGFSEFREQPILLEALGAGAAGIGALAIFASSKRIDQLLSRAVTWATLHWTRLEILDYSSLLQVVNGYGVCRRRIDADDWVAGKALKETKLRAEGILVLGVFRNDGSFEGTPRGVTVLNAGDAAVLYGRDVDVRRIAQRAQGFWGDLDHERAVEDHEPAPLPSKLNLPLRALP